MSTRNRAPTVSWFGLTSSCKDVAVIGLPDPERGERVCAVVQLADGVQRLTVAEMVECCKNAGLMTQKIPEQLEIRDEMPRAATGKIVKTKLRDAYGDAPWTPSR